MCNFKNHYRSKKWYGHGRTGRTAYDGPARKCPQRDHDINFRLSLRNQTQKARQPRIFVKNNVVCPFLDSISFTSYHKLFFNRNYYEQNK